MERKTNKICPKCKKGKLIEFRKVVSGTTEAFGVYCENTKNGSCDYEDVDGTW